MTSAAGPIAVANRLLQEERYREVLDTLAADSGYEPAAALMCGVAASRLGDQQAAVGHFTRAAELAPDHAGARVNLGLTLRSLGRDAEAEAAFQAALTIDEGLTSARLALANLLMGRGDCVRAAAAFEQVLRFAPGHTGALNNLGLCRRMQGRDADAADCFTAVLAHEPANANVLANLGAVRAAQGLTDEAIGLHRKALAEMPDHLQAANNLGVALLDKGRAGEAAAVLRPIVEAGRAGPETLANLGNALAKLGDAEGAGDVYDRALDLGAGAGLRFRRALLLPVIAGSGAELDTAYRGLSDRIDSLRASRPSLTDPCAEVGATAFNLSYHDACNRQIMARLADTYLEACPGLAFVAPHCSGGGRRPGPVRIGFVSRHFQTNSVGRCFHGVLRHPARDDVAVTAFTFSHAADPLWQAIAADVDRAVVLPAALGPARAALAAEALDVLVYTDIGMEPLTYFLSFARLAPVQCVLGGHPDAVGVRALDHYLSCDLQEPVGAEAHYRIPLVRLPGAPTWYERPELPDPLKPRAAFGLPADGALYFCSQTLIKVHPDMDPLFRAILERDPTGTLVLPEGYVPELAARLRARFARSLGAFADRVLFLPAMSHMDFMNVMALADVSLDTRPFGGGNTSWQAIAAGTPMVSWPGAYLRGRYTQALYRMIGVEEAIAGSAAEYVDRAVRLGTDAAFCGTFNRRVAAAAGRLFCDRTPVDAFYAFLVAAARC